MSRADEIAQGLRDEGGALIGGLDVLEYNRGHQDHDSGADWPKISSTSYDLGRARAARLAEETADVLAALNAKMQQDRQRMRELLKGHPQVLAEYERDLAALDDKTASPG